MFNLYRGLANIVAVVIGATLIGLEYGWITGRCSGFGGMGCLSNRKRIT